MLRFSSSQASEKTSGKQNQYEEEQKRERKKL